MMSPPSRTVRYFTIGIFVASVIGLTTDQILQNIYDSSNLALRTNVVVNGGGGGPTPVPQATATPLTFGSANVVAIFGSPELGSHAGSTCASGFGTALSSAGAWTCATPVPPTPVATATPQPTPTPVSPQYRAALNTSNAGAGLGTSGNNFYGLGGSNAGSITETTRGAPFPIALTVSNLSCYFSVAPASTKNWTITVRTGTCGATLTDSALTCTITGNGSLQTCTDNTHSVAISANQCASINIVGTNTPASTPYSCGVEADY